jgi:transcriptional adapter 2-alpha
MGLTTIADIEKFEADQIKRVRGHCRSGVTSLRGSALPIQIQAKASLSGRDYYSSERLQLRAGGRHSSGPDARASLASMGADSDGRKSHEREMTPKGVASAGSSVRKPRAFFVDEAPPRFDTPGAYSRTIEPG